MSLADMSTRTAFARPEHSDQLRGRVVLQLQFARPDSVGGALFALQVAVAKNYFDETIVGRRRDALGRIQACEFKGGSVRNLNLKGRDLAGTTCTFQILSVIGREFLLHTPCAGDLHLNARIRVLSLEASTQPNSIWLVRAEILSGGLESRNGGWQSQSELNSFVWGSSDQVIQGLFFSGSEFHVEVGQPRAKLKRRFRLMNVSYDPEEEVRQVLWEQIAASSDPMVQDPDVRINEALSKLTTWCKRLKVGHVQAETSSQTLPNRVLAVIQHRKHAETIRSEFFNTNIALRFDWPRIATGAKHSTPIAPTSDWRPKTLHVMGASLVLVDTDDLSEVLSGGSMTDAKSLLAELAIDSRSACSDPDICPRTWLQWKEPTGSDASLSLVQLPTAELVGANDSRANPTRDLWFQAASSGPTGYTNQPVAWVHLSAVEPYGSPPVIGPPPGGLNQPIVLELSTPANWVCQITPSATAPAAPNKSPRPKLLLHVSEKVADLAVDQSDLVLKGPEIRLYDLPVADARYVPNERAPHELQASRSTRLRFERQAGFDLRHKTVRCHFSKGDLTVRHLDHAARLFLPASRALVDPVSVTAGNLIGQQTVTFRLTSLHSIDGQRRPVKLQAIARRPNLKVAELQLEMSTAAWDEFNLANSTSNELAGFFVELVRDSDEPPVAGTTPADVSVVVRFRSAKPPAANSNVATFTVDLPDDISALQEGKSYSLFVGPTRLAIPRDVNHGLIAIDLPSFQFAAPVNGLPHLVYETAVGTEVQSVLALHPWSEWGPKANEWLRTGRIRLHHRNLIQEHAEFESSFDDRFPPEGPKGASGQAISPLLPLEDFLQAVRDRYTEASGNLWDPRRNQPVLGQVANWLPGATLKDELGQQIPVSLSFNEGNETDLRPSTSLHGELFKHQALKLRKAEGRRNHGDAAADQAWLDVNVQVQHLGVASNPTLQLTRTDPAAVNRTRAMNSSVSLLFDRHEISILALALRNSQPLLLWSSPNANARLANYEDSQKPDSAEHGQYADAAVLVIGQELYLGSITPAGLVAIGLVSNDLKTLTPLKLEEDRLQARVIVSDLSAKTPRFAAMAGRRIVLLEPPGNPHAKWRVVEVPHTQTAPTALTLSESDLVIGSPDGSAELWRQVGDAWTRGPRLSARSHDSPILAMPSSSDGDSSATLNREMRASLPPARALRSIAIFRSAEGERIVFACDGTRAMACWVVQGEQANEIRPSIDWRGSEALVLAAGRVNDLESRGGPQGDLDLLAIGYRSGEIEVRGRESVGFVFVRRFETPAPVSRLAMLHTWQAAEGPAAVVAGTSHGEVLAWDLRSGVEWKNPDRIAPSHSYDGLGVVRKVDCRPLVQPAGLVAGVVQELFNSAESRPIHSITIDKIELSKSADGVTANVTDIRFWCDSLKVDSRTGELSHSEFDNDRWHPGRYGFHSQVHTPADANKLDAQNLRRLDFFPRLYGFPIYVTRLTKLNLTPSNDLLKLLGVEFEAVLVNPDEVAAGYDPGDENTTPGFVREALNRGSVIKVRIDLATPSIDLLPDSRVDWVFAVNRQTPPHDMAAGFAGSVARLVGKVAVAPPTDSHPSAHLLLTVQQDKSEALVFGRLWKLRKDPAKGGKPSVQLAGWGRFEALKDSKGWRQLDFEMRSPPAARSSVQSFLADESEDLVQLGEKDLFDWDTRGYEPEDLPLHQEAGDSELSPGVRHAKAKRPAAGRYLAVIPSLQPGKVLLVDRITGAADRRTERFLGDGTAATQSPFCAVAVLEEGSSFALAAARETGEIEFFIDQDFDPYRLHDSPQRPAPIRFHWEATPQDSPSPTQVKLTLDSGGKFLGVATYREPGESGNKRLRFGPLPLTPGEPNQPAGSTVAQTEEILMLGVGQCQSVPFAVTVDGSDLKLWLLDKPTANVAPHKSLPVEKSIRNLCVTQDGLDLLVALSLRDEVRVFRVKPPEKETDTYEFDKLPSVTGTALGEERTLSLCTDLEGVLLVLGEGQSGETWRWEQDRGSWTKAEVFATSGPITALRAAGHNGDSLILTRDSGTHLWGRDGWLRISSRSHQRLQAALGVELDRSIHGVGVVQAHLTPAGDTRFSLVADGQATRAYARLTQDLARCFLLHPTSANASRGRQSLVLWAAGDLNHQHSAAGPLRLEAMHTTIEIGETQVRLKVNNAPGEMALEGRYVSLVVRTSHQPKNQASPIVHRAATLIANRPAPPLSPGAKDRDELTLILEGTFPQSDLQGERELSGLLCVRRNKTLEFQAAIRARWDFAKDRSTLVLLDDTYCVSENGSDPDLGRREAPEISLPYQSGTPGLGFSVQAIEPKQVQPRFVRLRLCNTGVRTFADPRSAIPFLPELESGGILPWPRLARSEVRLSHRQGPGMAMRPDMPGDVFRPVQAGYSLDRDAIDLLDQRTSRWLLEPLIEYQDRLVRARPEGWLIDMPRPGCANPKDRMATEGLLVVTRLAQVQTDASLLVSITDRTDPWTPNSAAPLSSVDDERYRQLLSEAGVRGIGMLYRLVDGLAPDFAFVESPYFDKDGRNADIPSDFVVRLGEANDVSSQTLPTIDRLLVLPEQAARQQQELAVRYLLDATPADPYADACCLATRSFRLRRLGEEPASPARPMPIMHLSVMPAFRQSAPLLPAADRGWLRPPTCSSAPGNSPQRLGPQWGNQEFFPPRLDWTLAADKPGAMFHTLVQPRSSIAADVRREPIVDFAQREPQFIRLTGCVTAAVKWNLSPKDIQKDGQRLDLLLKWEETLGSLPLERQLKFAWQTGPTPSLANPPLKLIVSFNGDVIPIEALDATVPAYRVEAQQLESVEDAAAALPEGKPKEAVRPAEMYLVTQDEDITGIKTRRRDVSEGSVTRVDLGGVQVSKLAAEGFSAKNGELVWVASASGESEPAGRWQRVIKTASGDLLLADDTVRHTYVGQLPKLKTVNGQVDLALDENSLDRPLTMLVSGQDAKAPETGEIVSLTIPAFAASARTGETVANFICWAEGKKVTLLAPSTLEGEVEVSRTMSVAPFLEADAPLPAFNIKIVRTAEATLSGALRLSGKIPDDPRWVRCKSNEPEVNGVFRLLPVAENSVLVRLPILVGFPQTPIAVDGAIKLLPTGASQLSAKITHVTIRQGQPPVISLSESAEKFVTGLPVSIVGNLKATPVDGTWVVEQVKGSPNDLLLYLASIAPPAKIEKVDKVAASAVMPLREAFKDPKETSGGYWSCKLDPKVGIKWKPDQRPMLQIYWAGLEQLKSDSGDELTPRMGTVQIPLYDAAKQIKFLANSLLSPKLAFVLSILSKGARAFERTMLFGDSAPAFAPEASIAEDPDNDPNGLPENKKYRFYLKISDNRERLSVQVPPNITSKEGIRLFVVKSLPSGVLVYDERAP